MPYVWFWIIEITKWTNLYSSVVNEIGYVHIQVWASMVHMVIDKWWSSAHILEKKKERNKTLWAQGNDKDRVIVLPIKTHWANRVHDRV
jgi:hypothetical protein